MHIKTVNTHSKYECIVMRGNDRVGLIGGRISGRQPAELQWCSPGC